MEGGVGFKGFKVTFVEILKDFFGMMAGFDYTSNQGGPFGQAGHQDQTTPGGFVHSPFAASPSTGAKKRAPGLQTLHPVTIKQLLDSTQEHADAPLRIGDVAISEVTLVGVVRDITHKSTSTSYAIEDGTGLIDVQFWSNQEEPQFQIQKRNEIEKNMYVRVYGGIRSFNTKRFVVGFDIRKITDFNEVTCHFLEVIYVHLNETKGNILSNNSGQGLLGQAAPPSYHFQANQAIPASSAYHDPHYNSPAIPAFGMEGQRFAMDGPQNILHQNIIHLVQQNSTGDYGVNVSVVINALRPKFSEKDVKDALSYLTEEGLLYSTINDMHVKVTGD